jgi:hypothetical protein
MRVDGQFLRCKLLIEIERKITYLFLSSFLFFFLSQAHGNPCSGMVSAPMTQAASDDKSRLGIFL